MDSGAQVWVGMWLVSLLAGGVGSFLAVGFP